MSHATGTNATVLSPVVTTYTPNAFINIDSALTETVTIAGIDNTFEINLDASSAAALLNGFDVSGVSVDCRLSQKDVNMGNLVVSMGGEGFKAVIEEAINGAVDASGNVIDAWLASQLRAAFLNAFASYLPTGSLGGDNNATAVNGNDASQVLNSDNEPATDAGAGDGTVAVTLETTISGFSVDVLTDASGAAANLIAQHTAAARASIFRQVGAARMYSYLPADASGAAVALTTSALPLQRGDSIEFVFDIDVDTAGANAGSDDAEDIPTAGTQPAAFGTASFSLNLANRRIALKIVLDNEGDVGTPFNVPGELKQNPVATVDTPNPGPGTNPA